MIPGLAPRKRILFAYAGGRRARLRDIESGHERPTEFLFGYTQLARQYDVEAVEGDPGAAAGASWRDRLLNHLAARLVGLGINTPAYLAHLPRLSACDALVAIPDSVALAFARLKHQRRIPPVPLVYVAMGLASRLQRRPWGYRRWRAFYGDLIGACDAVVALGRGEHEFLCELFPRHADRIHFIPFGVDTAYWRPSSDTTRDGTYLFVGNDPNRDFEMVRSLVRRRRDLRFRVVSSNSRLLLMRAPNAEVFAGDWRAQPLTDDQMRAFYRRSHAVIVPLRESLQPSGQSVALQALACGTPVVISRTTGFWDPEHWRHGEHVYFVDGGGVAAWSEALDAMGDTDSLRGRLAEGGRRLVEQRYGVGGFADALAAVIERITGPAA